IGAFESKGGSRPGQASRMAAPERGRAADGTADAPARFPGHNAPAVPVCPAGSPPATGALTMGLISLIWGIVALAWMILALLPVVGITNWLLIPFAAVGAILAAIGVLFTRTGRRGRAKAGLVLNALVIIVAIWRLGLGGGLI